LRTNGRFAPKAAIPAKVGYETEMPPQSLHVRYREQSGRHLLAASISPFDPLAEITSENWGL
jgi:hypothetical protein